MEYQGIKNHSILQTVFLHLLPGILKGCVYWLIVGWVVSSGYPSGIALVLSSIVSSYPFFIVVLILQARKASAWAEVIPYQNKLSVRSYLIWVPLVFLASGIIIALLGAFSTQLEFIFAWIPQHLRPDMELAQEYTGEYSIGTLIITGLLGLTFVGFIGPALEEFYFRGFLLPRMPLGRSAPIFHSVLFAVYHTWSPWMIVSRIFGVLPLIYAVRRTRNVFLGIWVHVLLNCVEFFIGFVIISRVLIDRSA